MTPSHKIFTAMFVIALALVAAARAEAQEEFVKPVVENLVLAGGGHWGLAHIGVLSVLEQQRASGRYDGAKAIIGTSIGSLYGSLYAAGYSPATLAFYFVRPANGNTNRANVTLVGVNAIQDYGLVSGTGLGFVLDQFYNATTGIFGITFEQLFALTDIELTVVAYNLNLQTTVYFNHLTAPNMKVSQAVVLSSSVPLLFTSAVYQGHRYIDGGVRDVYPFRYFTNQGVYALRHTLGSTFKPNYDATVIETVDDFAGNLLRVMQENNLPAIRPREAKRTIFSDMPAGIRDVETILTQVDANAIYQAGVTAATAFFTDPDAPF
jgi:predicted acylesterase/phospholipase RssA